MGALRQQSLQFLCHAKLVHLLQHQLRHLFPCQLQFQHHFIVSLECARVVLASVACACAGIGIFECARLHLAAIKLISNLLRKRRGHVSVLSGLRGVCSGSGNAAQKFHECHPQHVPAPLGEHVRMVRNAAGLQLVYVLYS